VVLVLLSDGLSFTNGKDRVECDTEVIWPSVTHGDGTSTSQLRFYAKQLRSSDILKNCVNWEYVQNGKVGDGRFQPSPIFLDNGQGDMV
jgi:hypothetical protein